MVPDLMAHTERTERGLGGWYQEETRVTVLPKEEFPDLKLAETKAVPCCGFQPSAFI